MADALTHADILWDGWLHATTAGAESELSSMLGDWPSSAAAIAAMVHSLRGYAPAFDEWRTRARRIAHVDDAAQSHAVAAPAAFADARVATHTGRSVEVPVQVAAALAPFPEKWWLPYAHAAGAELAVVAGLPDAAQRLADAAATENDGCSLPGPRDRSAHR